jgi:hypothetical protein
VALGNSNKRLLNDFLINWEITLEVTLIILSDSHERLIKGDEGASLSLSLLCF